MAEGTPKRPPLARPRPPTSGRAPRWIAPLVGFALVYGAAYGVARWRKVLVRAAYGEKETGCVVLRVGPGLDMRRTAWGAARNEVSQSLATVFRPLCALETWIRGSTEARR